MLTYAYLLQLGASSRTYHISISDGRTAAASKRRGDGDDVLRADSSLRGRQVTCADVCADVC
jgi:hypothetical protein